jgi:protein-S-isoprenylcysteine O-methyltransferase Ste14
LITLAMFPVLVVMYVRLAHREETQALSEFGSAYAAYTRETSRWVPRIAMARRAPRTT